MAKSERRSALALVICLALLISCSRVPSRPARGSDARRSRATPGAAQPFKKPVAWYRQPYRTVDGVTLYADVFAPTGNDTYPAVVVVHGGKWAYDENWNTEGRQLALSGFVAVVIEYRLAPPGGEWHFPADLRDVHAAIEWTRNHAATYRIQPGHVGVLGGSAGGNLAMLAAETGGGAARADAAVSWSGPADLPACSDLCDVYANYLGCPLRSCASLWREASPALMAQADTSPMYIANSQDEIIPVSDAQEMADRLAQLGVPYDLRILPGQSHSRIYARDVWPGTISFLHRWLG